MIGIIDVGVGNIQSIKNWLDRCTVKWEIIETSYALPHSIGTKTFFQPLLKIFKTLLGTIIFIKVKKK